MLGNSLCSVFLGACGDPAELAIALLAAAILIALSVGAAIFFFARALGSREPGAEAPPPGAAPPPMD